MAKKYLLPELNKTVAIDAVDFKGCWAQVDESYQFLLDNLHMDYESTESVFDGGSSGIPHIYEQMILFTNAFFDVKHPDHRRAVIEWRAVMILLAFKRIKNLNLDLVKVDLTGSSKNFFLSAASSFIPQDAPVFFQTTWDFLYMLLLDGVPVALFSPTTLVCPAKQFKNKISRLNWMAIETIEKEERLLLQFGGNGYEYSCLTEWLRRLKSEVHQAEGAGPDSIHRFEQIKKEFDDFIGSYAHGKYPETDPSYQERPYGAINTSIRKEYGFLNFCCSFEISNSKLRFLADRYPSDIFTDRILLLVVDNRPDAMFNRENLPRLKQLLDHIMEIDNRKIISVFESGGEELPFFAFMPFHRNFIRELVERDIAPDDFFESYQVEYNKSANRLDICLTIKEFPTPYRQSYSKEQWQLVYSQDMLPIYLWPKEKLPNQWKAYYTYAYCDNLPLTLDIPYKDSKATVFCPATGGGGKSGSFQIAQSESFPSFLRLACGGVSGWIPIKTSEPDLQGAGGTAQIYLDVGHANTSVAIVKKTEAGQGDKTERFPFRAPASVWVAGDVKRDTSVSFNFLPPCNVPEAPKELGHYFKNMLHGFQTYQRNPEVFSVKPFQDGHVLFEKAAGGDAIIGFINFDYVVSDEGERKRVHIFLEQILLYAVYEAYMAQCSYVEIKFLHRSQENEKLGELKGLWLHALNQVKQKTGIRSWPSSAVACMDEFNALTNHLYLLLVKNRGFDCKHKEFPPTELFVGVDIGWKKTLISLLTGPETALCSEIAFAGREISTLDSELNFLSYKNLLSLLLSGPFELDPDTEEGALLEEFGNLYNAGTVNVDYYYGLFDIIALKIEQNGYRVSPDIYNNMLEFRLFIKMITYHFLMLFFEIGCILEKMLIETTQSEPGDAGDGKLTEEQKSAQIKHIQIYLGGNGSKFLNWICNMKDFNEITETNCRELFIVRLNETLLDVVKKGLLLRFPERYKTSPPSCTITFVKDRKNQMIDGYLFHEQPGYYNCEQAPDIRVTPVEDELEGACRQAFYAELNRLSSDLFDAFPSMPPQSANVEAVSMTSAVHINSVSICQEIIAQINQTQYHTP